MGEAVDLIPIEDLRLALANRPACGDLLNNLSNHFGNSLKFESQPAGVRHGENDPRLDSPTLLVSIIVRVPTDERLAASLTHELLHAKMTMDGFPIGISVTFESRESIDDFKDIGNFAAHAIILPEFLSFGFQREEFFFNPDENRDVLDQRRHNEALSADSYGRRFARGEWNKLYFEQWMARKAGFSDKTDEVTFHGHQLFPNSMADDIQAMENWYERAEFRTPHTHAKAMNELLKIIGFNPVEFMVTQMTPDGLLWIASQGGFSLS
jgi:hypothetical protein